MRSALIVGLHGERMELVLTAGDQHGEGPAYRVLVPFVFCGIHLEDGNWLKAELLAPHVSPSKFTAVNFDRRVVVG